MDQHRAVSKMMLSIKLENLIPDNVLGLIRDYLKQMYCVGWEEGRESLIDANSKLIGQYNIDHKLVNVFKSEREAAYRTGYHESSISKSIKNNKMNRQKVFWKFIDIKAFNEFKDTKLTY
jgi:hypothetical protein